MTMRFLLGPLLLLIPCTLALRSQLLFACNIPVFRYALQRWQPDDYEIIILHRQALNESQSDLLKSLNKDTVDPEARANTTVRSLDVNQPLDERDKQLLTSIELFDELPWILVRYPEFSNTDQLLAYDGPFNEETVQALIDSPARRELVKRILGGDSAVWIFIESGDKVKDDAAEKILVQRLAHLETTLQLPGSNESDIDTLFPPEISDDDPANHPSVRFSVLRIAKHDPDERVFVAMLLNIESDLRERVEPITIPIFGRGRTYFALAGAGINDETIDLSCQFLTGACSCEVKVQNPGADMLIQANWDALVTQHAFSDPNVPPSNDMVNVRPLTGLGSLEEVSSRGDLVNKPVGPTANSMNSIDANPTVVSDIDPMPVIPAVGVTNKPIYASVIAVTVLGLIVISVGSVLIKRRKARVDGL